jgi:hypothetical protein
MITVAILINGEPLIARSATREPTSSTLRSPPIEHTYLCDDGTKIKHKTKDGAVELAKKMLSTINLKVTKC